MDYPLRKNPNFSTSSIFCFYSLEIHFSFVEYRETHFPDLFCIEAKDGKIANF